jgi:F plasmid transfer operon, TraF, protein
MSFPPRRVALLPLVLVLAARPAAAQTVFESAGERALGMAGAFVGVADDATAVYWNPAGLATGRPAGMTIGWSRLQSGNSDAAPEPGAVRRRGHLTSLGTWPLGASYGAFETTTLVAQEDGQLAAETLRTRQFGVTLVQSIVSGLVVGSTLKYVRGTAASAPTEASTLGEALAAGSALEGHAHGAFDLDVGVMADLSRVRVGLTMRNVRSPSFGDLATTANTLQRQARLGIAVLPVDGLTLAMDVDLDTVDLRGGLRRVCALGGEGQLGSRLMIRSGVRWSLESERRPVASVGMSVSVRRGLWLDGHYAQGRADEDREFGVALRAGL